MKICENKTTSLYMQVHGAANAGRGRGRVNFGNKSTQFLYAEMRGGPEIFIWARYCFRDLKWGPIASGVRF
ncbi:hypothetical protein L484_011053 [Morus notabilis]|uniref:Uncharacterized protein n=1 Tax=Morus notabilis TaxID=981085 RepID=W9QUD3_9ROSA|nr:hypothetical protein L484_011053 [Morus notabilis]